MKTSLAVALLLANTQALEINKDDALLIAKGIYEGALKTEHLDDYVTCTVDDGEHIAADVEDAITQLKSKSIAGVIKGMEDLGDVFDTMASGVQTCSQPKDLEELLKLKKMIASFKDPKVFIAHVGHDLIVNGVDIFKKVSDTIGAIEGGKYEAGGMLLGDILAETFIGELEMNMQENSLQVAEEITIGILAGAVNAEGLDNIKNCLHDDKIIIGDVMSAIPHFEKKDAKDVLEGIKLIGDAVSHIPSAITDCKGVVADIQKIEKMAAIFASPTSFVYHVAHDLVVNGAQIYHEIDDSITQYHNQQYEKFGEDVGFALAKLVLGEEEKAMVEHHNLFLY